MAGGRKLAACVAVSMVACASAFTTPFASRLPAVSRSVALSRNSPRSLRAPVAPRLRMQGEGAKSQEIMVVDGDGYLGVDKDGNKVHYCA